MNSFANDVRNEIARVIPKKLCCQKSELMSLLRMSSTNFVSNEAFDFSTSNAAIARKILLLTNSIDPTVKTRIEMKKAAKLRKNNRYIIHASQTENIFRELGYLTDEMIFDPKKIRRDCCRKSFLRGAFLGSGSVNRPEADYRLELTTYNFSIAVFLRDFLTRFEFNPRIAERGKKFVVYFQECELILDFLSMIQAPNAVERFESARNLKEIRSQVNMLVNLETANLQRSAEAIARQFDDISRLENSGLIKKLSSKMLQTIEARQKNPDANIAELADILSISEQTMKYRLKKLHILAGQA